MQNYSPEMEKAAAAILGRLLRGLGKYLPTFGRNVSTKGRNIIPPPAPRIPTAAESAANRAAITSREVINRANTPIMQRISSSASSGSYPANLYNFYKNVPEAIGKPIVGSGARLGQLRNYARLRLP